MLAVMPSDAVADSPDLYDAPISGAYGDASDSSGGALERLTNLLAVIAPFIVLPPPELTGRCSQRSHNPHASHHYPGRVNAEVRSTCGGRIPVPEMYHKAYLGKSDRDRGYNDVPNLTKGSDVFHEVNVWKGSSFSNNVCEDQWYKTRGEGYIVYVEGGSPYYWATASKSVDNPCGL